MLQEEKVEEDETKVIDIVLKGLIKYKNYHLYIILLVRKCL